MASKARKRVNVACRQYGTAYHNHLRDLHQQRIAREIQQPELLALMLAADAEADSPATPQGEREEGEGRSC